MRYIIAPAVMLIMSPVTMAGFLWEHAITAFGLGRKIALGSEDWLWVKWK